LGVQVAQLAHVVDPFEAKIEMPAEHVVGMGLGVPVPQTIPACVLAGAYSGRGGVVGRLNQQAAGVVFRSVLEAHELRIAFLNGGDVA